MPPNRTPLRLRGRFASDRRRCHRRTMFLSREHVHHRRGGRVRSGERAGAGLNGHLTGFSSTISLGQERALTMCMPPVTTSHLGTPLASDSTDVDRGPVRQSSDRNSVSNCEDDNLCRHQGRRLRHACHLGAMKWTLGTIVSVTVAILLLASPASASKITNGDLESKLVRLSQLPTGWSVDNSGAASSAVGGCLGDIAKSKPPKGDVRVAAHYERGILPDFEEELRAGPTVASDFGKLQRTLNGCSHLDISRSGSTYSAAVGAMSFPKIGNRSDAYQTIFDVKGITLGVDIVIFQAGSYGDVLTYVDLGAPDVAQLASFARLSLKDLGRTATKA